LPPILNARHNVFSIEGALRLLRCCCSDDEDDVLRRRDEKKNPFVVEHWNDCLVETGKDDPSSTAQREAKERKGRG